MFIDFDEKHHTYYLNGEIVSVSVTEMLANQGIGDSYDNVDREILRESIKKGKEVHADIEKIFKEPAYEPTTEEGRHFDKWVAANVMSGTAEIMLGYKHRGLTVCGTADLIGFTKDGNLFVGDHKTTSKVNKEYVAWQTSIYDYFLRKLDGDILNGKAIHWKGAAKFYCFHYDKEGLLKVYELEKIPDEEIEKMLECEYTGKKYQRPMLAVDSELIAKFEEAELVLKEVEEKKKKAEVVCKGLRKQLLDLFEEQGIKSWESPDKRIKVTYVSEIDRITCDSDKVKKLYPDVFIATQKLTKIKPQIRIKIREDSEDD